MNVQNQLQIHQTMMCYTPRVILHSTEVTYGLLTPKGYLLIIMENVTNQQYQASGMVRAQEKTKSHLYCHCCTQTNQLTNNLSQVEREGGRGELNDQTEKWLEVLI